MKPSARNAADAGRHRSAFPRKPTYPRTFHKVAFVPQADDLQCKEIAGRAPDGAQAALYWMMPAAAQSLSMLVAASEAEAACQVLFSSEGSERTSASAFRQQGAALLEAAGPSPPVPGTGR